MLIIAGYVRTPPGVKPALQAPLEAFVAATRAEPGCRDFSFGWDAIEPDLLRVFEIFDDEAAFIAHGQSEHMRVWREARETLGVVGRELTAFTISAQRKI